MQTHAEKTNYRETPNYADTITFAQQLANASPAIEYRSFGHSGQGRELPLLIASEAQTFTPEAALEQQKAVVLIQACIHSGEPDGKDAGFALLRDDHVRVAGPHFRLDGYELDVQLPRHASYSSCALFGFAECSQ